MFVKGLGETLPWLLVGNCPQSKLIPMYKVCNSNKSHSGAVSVPSKRCQVLKLTWGRGLSQELGSAHTRSGSSEPARAARGGIEDVWTLD